MTRTHEAHRRFPDGLAFMLNNPLRRFLSPPGRLVSKLKVGPKDVVLDFGCGPGFFTVALAKISAKTIGVDISPRMLERAAGHARKNGVAVELMQSDGRKIELNDESVDLVLAVHVLHEVEDRPKVLGEFFRILRLGGRLAIVERTRSNGILSGKLGPPIISEDDVIRETTRTGFTFAGTIAHGKDSIINAQKITPQKVT